MEACEFAALGHGYAPWRVADNCACCQRLGGSNNANPATPSRPVGFPPRVNGNSTSRLGKESPPDNFRTPAPQPRSRAPLTNASLVKLEPPATPAAAVADDDWSGGIFADAAAPTSRRSEAMMVIDANAGAGQADNIMDLDLPSTTTAAAPDTEKVASEKPFPIRRAPQRRPVLSRKEQEAAKAEADENMIHAPFSTIHTLNEHLGTEVDPSVKKGKVSLGMSIDPQEWSYRYMFEQKRAYTAGEQSLIHIGAAHG